MSARTVFLSHRRKDFGKHFARLIERELTHKGYDVFLDVETLEAGKWETQILAGIAQRAHFLLLLTPGCFDGCDSPDDWVRREFERAVETGRNIVLIFEQDALYADLKEHCPEPMRPAFDYQGHRIHDTSFAKDIEILLEKYLHPSKAPSPFAPLEKDAILQRLDALAQPQKLTVASIRGHLLESTERQRDADLAAAAKATPSAERQRLRETALAAHQSRLSRIDELALSFAEIEGRADATAVFQEMTRILAEEGVDPALTYVIGEKSGILDRIRRRKQIEQERTRTELQPLLRAADLQATSGQTDAARAAYRELLALDPAWPAALESAAWFLFDQTIQNKNHGTLRAALADAEEGHALATRLHSADPEKPTAQRLLYATHTQMGDVLFKRGQEGDADKVLNHYTRSLEFAEKLLAANPGSAQAARDVSVSLERLGDFLARRGQPGDPEQALAHYTRSLEVREKLLAANPGSAEAARDVSVSLNKLGDFLAGRGQPGDPEQALAHYTRDLEISEKLLAANPGSAQAARDVSVSLNKLGDFLAVRGQPGDPEQALVHYTRCNEVLEKLLAANPGSAQAARDVSVSLNKLGDFLAGRGQPGDPEQARAHYTRSLEVREKLLAANPGSAEAGLDVAISHERLGDFACDHGKADDAKPHYLHSSETWERMRKANPDSAYHIRGGVIPLLRLADLANRRNDPKDATRHRRAIYDLLQPNIERGMTFDPPIMQLYEEIKTEFHGR